MTLKVTIPLLHYSVASLCPSRFFETGEATAEPLPCPYILYPLMSTVQSTLFMSTLYKPIH